ADHECFAGSSTDGRRATRPRRDSVGGRCHRDHGSGWHDYHWNRAAEQLFGYSAREAIGTNIGIIVPGERKGEMLGELGRIARGERVHHYETVRVAKDGRSIGVSLSVFPVRSPSGAIVGRVQDCSRHHGKEKRGEDSFVGKLQWTLLFR